MIRASFATGLTLSFAVGATAQEITTLKTDRLEVDVSLRSPRIMEWR